MKYVVALFALFAVICGTTYAKPQLYYAADGSVYQYSGYPVAYTAQYTAGYPYAYYAGAPFVPYAAFPAAVFPAAAVPTFKTEEDKDVEIIEKEAE